MQDRGQGWDSLFESLSVPSGRLNISAFPWLYLDLDGRVEGARAGCDRTEERRNGKSFLGKKKRHSDELEKGRNESK